MAHLRVLDKPVAPAGHVNDLPAESVDIVFVHGLNPKGTQKHERLTWTHEDGTFWPESLLAPRITFARIMIFRYNAAIMSGASNASIQTHANSLLDRLFNKRREESQLHRPLIFVAHSMGGLVVKQALIDASLNPRYYCIKTSTYGLVFFATPHSGGNKADVADFVANIWSAAKGGSKNSLLKQLQKGSIINEISTEQFSNQMGDYDVLTYFETKMTKVKIRNVALIPQFTNMYVVDKPSAILGSGRDEKKLDLDRNHSEICKFTDGDPAYEAVGPNIESLAQKAREHKPKCKHTNGGNSELQERSPLSYANGMGGAVPNNIALPRQNPLIGVPQRCKSFIGRGSLMSEITEWWNQSEGSQQRKLSLTGLGGAGKTELSLWIIEKLGPHPFILWFPANGWEAFEDDLRTSALYLKSELFKFNAAQVTSQGLGDSQGAPRIWFSQTDTTSLTETLGIWMKSTRDESSKILVILDDLDCLDNDFQRRISRMFTADTLDLVYTARNPSMADRESIWEAKNFEVSALQRDDAANLLDDFVKGNSQSRHQRTYNSPGQAVDGTDRAMTVDLAEHLGGLPAAIINGSHYLKDHFNSSESSKSLRKLLEQWETGPIPCPASRGYGIFEYRHDTFKYTHTILGSFEVSKARLRRNTQGKDIESLYQLSLEVLQLLSVLRLGSFKREKLDTVCQILGDYYRTHPEDDLQLHLSGVDTIMNRCVTELMHVSLLSSPDADGNINLNDLTMSCALLRPHSVLQDQFSQLDKIAAYIRDHDSWRL